MHVRDLWENYTSTKLEALIFSIDDASWIYYVKIFFAKSRFMYYQADTNIAFKTFTLSETNLS